MNIPKKGCYIDIVDVNNGKLYFEGWKKPNLNIGIPATAIVIVYKNKADFKTKELK